MFRKLIFIFIGLCLFTGGATATDYYVSPTGTGDGSTAELAGDPSTIDGYLADGDTMYFLPGTYSGESIEITTSGTAENLITLTASSTTPIITGSSKTGTGITISGDYVTVDGLNITNYSKGINASTADYLTIQNCQIVNNFDGLYIDSCNYTTIQDNTILGNILLEDSEGFESGTYDGWTPRQYTGVTNNSTTNLAVANNNSHTGFYSVYLCPKGKQGDAAQSWVQKQYNLSSSVNYQVVVESYYTGNPLNPAGEAPWYLASATKDSPSRQGIYLYNNPSPFAGHLSTNWNRGVWWNSFDKNDTTFYAWDGVLTSYTYSCYIDDLKVTAFGKDTNDGIIIRNSQQSLIKNNIIKSFANDSVYLDRCSYPSIDSCNIEYSIKNAINTTSTCSYITLKNSTIFKCGISGVEVYSSNFIADNNTVEYTYNYGIQAEGNIIPIYNNTLTNNTVVSGLTHEVFSGAGLTAGMNSTVAYNTVSYGIQGIRAGANTVIRNNNVFNISGNSIDIEYRQYNLTIENNTFSNLIYHVGDNGLRLKMMYGSHIKNNSFHDIANAMVLLSYNSIGTENNVFENNVIEGGSHGVITEDIYNNHFINNSFSNLSVNVFELQGPTETWTSFRNGASNRGGTPEFVLPSPYGTVTNLLSMGYVTPGLETLWNSNLTTPIKSTPATYDNLLYVVTNGTLYSINNNDGSQIWNYSTGNIYPATVSGIGNILIHSSPAIANSIIYFGSGNTLYAVNTSGSLIWSYPTEGQVISSPEISGGNVYVGSTDGKLYAINANNGTLAWSYNLGDAIVATPCIVPSVSGSHAGITAKGFNGKVAEVLDNGTEQWNKTLSKPGGWSSPVFDTYLYIATSDNGSSNSSVYAINIVSGTETWNRSDIHGDIIATPTTYVGHVNLVTDNGAFNLLLLGSGTKDYENISYSSSGYTASPVGFTSGYFSVDKQGQITRDYIYSTKSNVKFYWRSSVPTNVSSSPIHSYGKLFICGENGVIYAFVPPSDLIISGNTINNVPVGIYSYSTEANVTNNTFNNVGEFIKYTQYFSRNCIIENNHGTPSNITINSVSNAIAKTTNIPNISFADSRSKYSIENDNILLTTQLNTAGKITRSIPNDEWSKSRLSWNDIGADFTATYTISGLEPDEMYYVKKDGTVISTYIPGSDGKLTFSNSEWSEHNFTIESDEQYPPVADFSSNITTGNYPLRVQFTDTSTGNITEYAWDFDGNGVTDSTEQNPICKYKAKGNYTVSLTSSNVAGSNTSTKLQYINVTGTTPPRIPFFSWFADWINNFYRQFTGD